MKLSINGSTFLSNDGAIDCRCELGTIPNIISINNSTFLKNYNSKYYTANFYFQNADLNISDCSFINNTESGNYNGGAISIDTTTALIRNTSFLNNFALSGGAIFINTLTTYTTIVDCLFTNNSATHFGGAIYALSDKDVIIRGTKFIENFANVSGGAIYSWRSNYI